MDDFGSTDPEAPRPRPRVVDKRVSARAPSEESPEQAPAETAAPETAAKFPDPPPPPAAEPAADREAEEAMIRQIAATPSRDWIVNVLVTLMNVADVKLGTGALDDARMAIEAVAATVERLGDDLGEAAAPLRQGLAQLQLAYSSKAGT